MPGGSSRLTFHVSHRVDGDSGFCNRFLHQLNAFVEVPVEKRVMRVLELALCHQHGVCVVD